MLKPHKRPPSTRREPSSLPAIAPGDQDASCAGDRQCFCGHQAAVRSTRERIKFIKDFLSKDVNACRRINSDAHTLALDSKNGEGNVELGKDNPSTKLSTQH